MGFKESADLARFPGFRDRVQVAMMTAAKDVAAEIEDASKAEQHRLRRALAMNVLTKPDDWIDAFAWAVVANPVIAYDSPDDAIQFTVNSVWNGISGVPTAQ